MSADLQLHPEIANALETGVRNRDFWLWLRAYRDDDAPIDTGELCERVEAWLAGLEREVTRARPPAEFVYETETFEVRLTAAPKGDSTRGGGDLVMPPVIADFVQ